MKMINFIDLDDVIHEFCELTGFTTGGGGIWNADWSRIVIDIQYPEKCELYQGESKLIYEFRNPDELLDYGYKGLSKDKETIFKFTGKDVYKDKEYFKLHLDVVILYCILHNKFPMDDALYFQKW